MAFPAAVLPFSSFWEGERTLILCGHIDTVAPGDESNWTNSPLKASLRDGRLIGRGVCDMKGGIACALYAVKAILDSGINPRGKLVYLSVIGEEDGGCGALDACLRGYKADAGVIMEPSETKLAPAVAGAMSFKVTVPGRSVHAAVREEGVSAIDNFILLYQGLRELEQERNKKVDDPLYSRYQTPYAISVGTVNGGTWPGTVPESLTFQGRIGVAVGESEAHARRELEAKVNEVADSDPWLSVNRPTVEWVGYSFASSSVPLDHPVVEALSGAYRDVNGLEPTYEGMTYASDARLLIKVAGTPTMVFGPGDVRVAHGADEYVTLDDLRTTVKTLTVAILRFLGV